MKNILQSDLDPISLSTMPESETTISILKSDKERLDKLKLHRREPYKEALSRLLDDIEKIKKREGGRLPPESYSSYIKGLIDSAIKAEAIKRKEE
jgi:hypothetical protein